VLAYASAVSNVVIPALSAASTHCAAMSFSTCDPWVSQLPYVISETLSPDLPRYLNSMLFTLLLASRGGWG
jgi:hypothetical protein